MITDEIRAELFSCQDLKYRDFHSKLMPDYDKNSIIGVRSPQVRSIAKAFSKREDIDGFLFELPHKFYEENNVQGFIICGFSDYDKTVKYLDDFLPYVDNWATCDLLKPKAFSRNKDRLINDIDRWLESDKTYTKRFAMGMLMAHFLDEAFKEEYLEKIYTVRSEDYYLNMMKAWFFATALAKQWESSVKVIENNLLDRWSHNKAIQKAVESYRITDEQKVYLKTLKIK